MVVMIGGDNPFLRNPEKLRKALSEVRGKDLNEEQLQAYLHDGGPLWIVAGPGSGKTEVLCWRVMKLLLVDGVPPDAIFLTTFTEKAADNLVSRLTIMTSLLEDRLSASLGVDLQGAWIGTLHSLANRVLLTYRYEGYQNLRLMDEFEQLFFALDKCSFMNSETATRRRGFSRELWAKFGASARTRQERLRNGLSILNRLVEDDLDLDAMRRTGDPILLELLQHYDQYVENMKKAARCDFGHLQRHFLDFLGSPQGGSFLEGIKHVLVDEYQDTNPIQEAIYFALAGPTGNLTVVGDDDQALYRFRGASVDHLVNFGQRCKEVLKRRPAVVQLRKNYRSHKKIVDFFNRYVVEHPSFQNARAPGKRPMTAMLDRGNYEPVVILTGGTIDHRARRVACMIKILIDSKMVKDPSHVAVLFLSTKETPGNAGPLIRHLRELNVPYYNPRSRSVQEDERVQQLLGVLIELLDPDGEFLERPFFPWGSESNLNKLRSFRQKGLALLKAPEHEDLAEFMRESRSNLEKLGGGTWLKANIHQVFYRLLNLSPFSSYLDDPETCSRYALLSQLFEKFTSVHPVSLKTSSKGGRVSRQFLMSFYSQFLGTILAGGLNDLEQEKLVPPGYVQIMTYHQAKGLEFPYVFLMSLRKSPIPSIEHEAEEIFNMFRRRPANLVSVKDRAAHDLVRRVYVGMSRAMVGLVLNAGPLDQMVAASLGVHAGKGGGGLRVSLGGGR
ncbi:MAG: hypothetical protein Kow0069_30630 [Promethearchaeota archaeon]